MKKIAFLAVLLLMLSGCSKSDSFETMSDEYYEPPAAQAQQTSLILADESVMSITGETQTDRIYLCDDFCIMVETFAGGDLDATIRSVTGFSKDRLLVMQRRSDTLDAYECVWAAAGEGGDQIGKMLLLDDGSHHYVLSVMADAEKAGGLTETWQLLFDSFRIGQPETTKG